MAACAYVPGNKLGLIFDCCLPRMFSGCGEDESYRKESVLNCLDRNLLRDRIMKTIFTLAAVLLSSASAFAFQPGMSIKAVDAEVRAQADKGESLANIASAAKLGGVPAGVMTSSFILTGNSAASAVSALVRAGFSGADVVNAAVSMGGDRNALNAVAIAAGVDPTSLLDATASGGRSDGAQGNQNTPSETGLNASGFGQSRASSVGGGGRSSVSPS